MIVLTKLRGERFTLNCDLIETMTENPDTTILLTNGSLHIVKEPMQEVIDKTVEFRRRIYREKGREILYGFNDNYRHPVCVRGPVLRNSVR